MNRRSVAESSASIISKSPLGNHTSPSAIATEGRLTNLQRQQFGNRLSKSLPKPPETFSVDRRCRGGEHWPRRLKDIEHRPSRLIVVEHQLRHFLQRGVFVKDLERWRLTRKARVDRHELTGMLRPSRTEKDIP